MITFISFYFYYVGDYWWPEILSYILIEKIMEL